MLRLRSVRRWTLFVSFFLAAIAAALSVEGGVAVRVANRIPGQLDAPVYDVDGQTRLEKPNYMAQLYMGYAADQLRPVAFYHTFGVGADAGYLVEFPGLLEIADAGNPGETLVCQLRVWDNSLGFDYASAQAAGGICGASEPFELKTTADPATPLPLLGLKSFQLRAPQYGTIDFRNLVPGVLDAPILDVDGSRLSGGQFVAQLYAKVATNLLTVRIPIGSPAPFGVDAQAGYWNPGTLILTNMAGGQVAEIEIVVWELSKGATFEEAARALGKRGQSKILQVKTGNEGATPSPPAILDQLSSFQLGGPAPGLIYFSNRVPGELDAPVQDAGPGLVAQLYAAREGFALEPVGAPVSIKNGYWQAEDNGIVALPRIQAGEVAKLQVRVWDSNAGTTYEEGFLTGRSGTSATMKVRTGGSGTPPSSPAILKGLQIWYIHSPHALLVRFANLIPGELDAPILGPDGLPLSGTNFVAQLYGRALEDMEPLGQPAPFGTGEKAGYWDAGPADQRAIDIMAGCCADLQVRIWDRTKGETYESATGGPRAISQTEFYFANVISWSGTNQVSPAANLEPLRLNTVGVAWMNEVELPSLMVGCFLWISCGASIYDINPDQLLRGTNYVAQLYVAPDAPDTFRPGTDQVNPDKLVAVGPIAPVRDGNWALPPNTVVQLPTLTWGQNAVAVLRIWDVTKGRTYDEAAVNGSILGDSSAERFMTPGSIKEPPTEITFRSSIYMRGRLKTISAPPGLSLLANPFAAGAPSYLSRLLPNPPEGTMAYVFDADTQGYHVAYFDFGMWNGAGVAVPFGGAFFLFNPSTGPLALNFEGVEGKLPDFLPSKQKPLFYGVSSTTGGMAELTDVLGFSLLEGDMAYRFSGGQWSVSQFSGSGEWSSFKPELVPGEGLFIRLMPRP